MFHHIIRRQYGMYGEVMTEAKHEIYFAIHLSHSIDKLCIRTTIITNVGQNVMTPHRGRQKKRSSTSKSNLFSNVKSE